LLRHRSGEKAYHILQEGDDFVLEPHELRLEDYATFVAAMRAKTEPSTGLEEYDVRNGSPNPSLGRVNVGQTIRQGGT